MRRTIITLFAAFLVTVAASAQEKKAPFTTMSFVSKDGLQLTADLYRPHQDSKTPFIVLFHQAGWSRGEYREIAPRLNAMGFNCLAVDQRSGKGVNGVANDSAARAKKKKLGVSYVDARQDIVAALELVRKRYAKGPLLAWGSSYSAALVLQVTGTTKELADGVLSFAPGEYFARLGKAATWVRDGAKSLEIPTFITSAKREKPNWAAIYEAVPSKKKSSFLPETKGNHGSRALWKQFSDSPAYWKAVTAFLDQNFPREKKTEKAAKKPSRKG